MNLRLLRLLAPLACLLAASLSCLTQAQSAAQPGELERLREDYAMRYLEPEPHMALAKYFRDHGDRLQAAPKAAKSRSNTPRARRTRNSNNCSTG